MKTSEQVLIEKICSYSEVVNCNMDIITIKDENYFLFNDNKSINNFVNYINSLKEYNFKTLDDVCDFLDMSYCYNDEVYFCELCGEYHFFNEGYYTTEYDICGVECLEKNINDFVDEFVNNSEKALLNEVPELEELGFKKAKDEYNGSYMRGGKVYNPSDILEEVFKKYEYNVEVIFYITYSTPYDLDYSYYYRIEEE